VYDLMITVCMYTACFNCYHSLWIKDVYTLWPTRERNLCRCSLSS